MTQQINDVPFVAIGNDEIAALPDLGPTIKCWACGERHEVQESREIDKDGKDIGPGALNFFKCPKDGNTYMCGIGGREWRPKHD